ncbi:MAG: hypothetical protein K2Q32_02425, partial [Alphaproteobacteria bacterium]|nr:hypothetical protein [Alphaproteobacteria bacterium]
TKYHPGKFKIEETTIEQWLAQPHAEPYDIVCLFGVLYAFSDYFTILKQAAALSREWVAIDALYPKIENPDNFCGVVFIRNQPINLADKNASVVGRGTRISPKGMIWLMEEFGYSAPDYLILPSLSSNDVDVYRYEGDLSKKRYLMRFKKDVAASKSITRQLIDGDGHILTWEEINRLRQSENN